MSDTLCPTRDGDVPKRWQQWKGATAPVPEGVRRGTSIVALVRAEATKQPPNGLESKSIAIAKAVA